ncbi:MAG: di-heme oxidoredictase family protein, partial [Planctomycetota bacterium]
ITPDGITGRYNTDGLGHVGRLGYKLQANFIEAFIRGAAFNQMGITTDPVEGSDGVVSLSMMRQVSSTLDDPTTDNDGIPDPEMSVEDLTDLIIFCRFIRPPHKKEFGADELAGEALFDSIGCTSCHMPTIESTVGPLEAYTDLLLHDLGPANADGISQGIPEFSQIDPFTTESEFRTQPLWGVSMHAPYMHDGSADTLLDAILAHGGEATNIRLEFEALTPTQQEQVIKFLEAL